MQQLTDLVLCDKMIYEYVLEQDLTRIPKAKHDKVIEAVEQTNRVYQSLLMSQHLRPYENSGLVRNLQNHIAYVKSLVTVLAWEDES